MSMRVVGAENPRILLLNLSQLHFVFTFEDEVVREFNPGGDGRMRCAAGVAAIVRMGPLSIKSRRREGGTIWHFCPWADLLLGESLLLATNSNLSK